LFPTNNLRLRQKQKHRQSDTCVAIQERRMEQKMSGHKPLKLLGRRDLENLGISYSNVHLLRLEADGKFPKRLYLSPARVAWVESEILKYLGGCIAARD
jgi:prophage regulatory protein